jgi:elongation factor Ts
MAQITAAMVKELREKTGAGMMDCKKALTENDGDIEKAIEFLRKKGLAAAAKKAGRVAAEGAVVDLVEGSTGLIAEINSETDFVAKNDEFKNFAAQIAKIILDNKPANVDELMKVKTDNGKTVEEFLTETIAKIGEKISIRRFKLIEGDNVSTYIHMGGKIGVIVNLEGGDERLAKDLCLHIAATNPLYMDSNSVDPEYLKKEEEIFRAKLIEQGKPEKIIPNIIKGQVAKLLKEVCLVNQAFVKDPDTTIQALLNNNNAKIIEYARFQLGEGIEKKQDNFVEEVMKQAKGE